ncbi:MAG: hypothetical protein JXB17_06090 [Bacteroidales bacterium]|nr:hypothetical protein [Bacteroidales bacterium]
MNTPYPLFPISITTILFYLLSYYLSKQNILKVKTHRKIWNIILLITFLVTALIGLTLVIKINYKLEIPFYEKLLSWHVEFGIGMALVAIFHLLWHLKYYLDLFKIEKSTQQKANENIIHHASVIPIFNASIFLIGFTAVITQILLLREFLSVLNGNELIIAIIIGNWMIITSAGAYLGKYTIRLKNINRFVLFILISISLLPLLIAFLINLSKNVIFPVGTMISLYQIFLLSFILLLPYCLFSGIAFTFFAHYISEISKKNIIRKVYAVESYGSVIGGLLLSFVLIYLFSNIKTLNLILFINSLFIVYLSHRIKEKIIFCFAFSLAIIAFFSLIFINLNEWIKKPLFPNQEIVSIKDTPKGNFIITNRSGQNNYYINNILFFDSENQILNEESVHFAIVQHPDPKQILIISGGITGRINEILKYNIEKIDYVELNKWIIQFSGENKKYIENNDTIELIISDPRSYIKHCDKKYDVVLINLPEPNTLNLNRFYTLEFFNSIKSKLNKNGVISFSLLSSYNYLNEENLKITSTIYSTVRQVFKNIIIVLGEKNYFIASDEELTYNISRLIAKKNITTDYVNEYYINDDLLKNRGELILKNLYKTNLINKDFNPIVYHQHILYWLSYFSANYWILGIILIVLIIFLLFKSNIFTLGLFTTGFSASSLEILLLFGFQIIFGNLYFLLSILITLFMLGLALGSYYQDRILKNIKFKHFFNIQYLIGFSAFLFVLILFLIKTFAFPSLLIYTLLFSLTMFIGVLIGFEFSLGSQLYKSSYPDISGKLYSYDLVGSAFGMIVVSIFFIPLFGIIKTSLLIGFINIIMGFYTFIISKVRSI